MEPKFTLPSSICIGDTPPILPTVSNNGIVGNWNPSIVSNTASGSYVFTPSAGQCATITTGIIAINPLVPIFIPAIQSICSGETTSPLPTTSTNGITGTWSPAFNNTSTNTYTFTPNAGQCAPTTATATMTVIINPITAVFTQAAPICSGQTLAPLPNTSDNGVTGSWSPTINNTTTTTYTFTPNAGQCATATTDMTILVNPNLTPTFSFATSICENDEAPLLPTISDNGITGTWNTPTVSNTVTGTYTFTSAEGQCTNPAPPITVTVKPYVTPIFNPIPNVCYGSAAPSLPTISTNGISGTWNPATVSNTDSGTYTFSATSGACITTTTLNIMVDTIIPIFNIFTSICINAIAPLLPTISDNGITGTWNPATVSNTNSGTYTFTPDDSQCSPRIALNITVNPIVTASFTLIDTICSGATSPILPSLSNNLIAGTWNPATVSNIASATYTFTPTDGQCAIGTTLNVTVTPNVTPTFTVIDPICSGSTRPVLPTISTNSITGSWNPSTVSNTDSGTYTFTPSAGQCALVTTLSIVVYQSPTDIVFSTTDVVNDGPDGIIEITGVTSGVAPFQYSINNGSYTADTSYSGLLPGNYSVNVRDSKGCIFNKSATISSICMFPNAITPNNDSFNDTFNLNGCEVIKLELFNRYGVEVKNYGIYSDQWDGTNNKGESLPDGTYYYVAEIKGGTSKAGWVFIAR